MEKKKRKEWIRSYACSAPSLLLIGLMVVFPILYTFYISLTNMNVYHWFDFTLVGLDNYIRALFVFDSGFLSALLATILWTAVSMVLQLVIAFLLANLLNIEKLRLRKLYKTVLMFPWAIPGYVGILLWKTGTVNIAFIEEAIRQDIARTPNKFVKLSNVTRRLCRTLGVKIVEVKSTNIRNDLKVESDFTGDYDNVKSVQKLLETIRRKDDVFCYPKLKRRESDPGYCLDDYCREVQERFSEFDGCKGENLRRRVIAWECENQCCDIYVRVYLDRPAKKGFVIGWMQKEELLDDTVQFKRMRQKNKSELALYFAKNLGETKGIDCLAQAFGKPKQRVYANPYTPTNFYHKTDDCKFIRRVPKEELLIFDSEEAAIQNGRFINRCRECFSKDG